MRKASPRSGTLPSNRDGNLQFYSRNGREPETIHAADGRRGGGAVRLGRGMSVVRYALLGAVIALGCASQTFDLLGQDESPARNEGGQGGEGEESSGGSSGKAGGGFGGSAGKAPAGGSFGFGGAGGAVGGSGGKGVDAGNGGLGGRCPGCCPGPTCLECDDDPNRCASNPPYTMCRELPEYDNKRFCVQCGGRDDCAFDQACNPITHACEPRCAFDPMTAGAICTDPRPYCDPGLRTCLACLSESHCPASRHFCFFGQCVQCLGNQHCDPSFVCDDQRFCRYCRMDEECGFGRVCNGGLCQVPPTNP